ncbi:gamma subclass chorismate mutase AroQ [Halomonas huangheensis]|uniref:chorismate mutase n=1 Tax=Halomonas huangheensis TaxID=1178482 RepID=W1N7V5_9GAMM|nr:gamma subclass chorismate mutase AroQ [Halomonas huangheensis]ALM53256.1 hypothetical protein AR456_13920 [Halomonas huangheensis]ERL51613.1 hypothetical protein BJB45_13230 [Halomonas huangheensis]
MSRVSRGLKRVGLRHALVLAGGLMIGGVAQADSHEVSDDARQTLDGLLEQVEQRLMIAPDVAKAKWNSGAPINVPERETQILDRVVVEARQQGVDEDLAHSFFQDQFDASKTVQQQLHQQWQQESRPPFDSPPDLASDIRPRLDVLTPQMIQSLSEFQALESNHATQQYFKEQVADAIAEADYPQALDIALQALRAH